MGKVFRRVSATGALLTVNALRPQPASSVLQVPSFTAGWLTSELAVQNLGVVAAMTAAGARSARGRWSKDDRLALGLNLVSLAGLAVLVRQAVAVRGDIDRALADGIGAEALTRTDRREARRERLAPWRQLLAPFTFGSPGVTRTADIDYVGDGELRHRLDVYTPDEPGTLRPVLLQIHGGAWIISRKEEQGLPMMNYLASRGFVCVATNYPLSPKAHWPEHLVALKHALAWTREHAHEFGGDPDFIAVTGGSAGGHLAAMMGLTGNEPRYQPGFEAADTSVQACVPLYGVYDLADTMHTRAGKFRLRHFLARIRFADSTEAYKDATPLTHVRADAPPFFLVHGERDSLAPVAEARELTRLLRTTSTSGVVYAELPGAQHGFDVFHSLRGAQTIRGMERFLRWAHEAQRRS